MKGIIVVDIPECCGDCDLYNWKKHECQTVGSGDCKAGEHRQENCPIKPIPEKDNKDYGYTEFEDGIKTGWNWCIDKILRGDENGQEQTTDR